MTRHKDDLPLPSREPLADALRAAHFAASNSTPGTVGRGIRDEHIKELVEGAEYAFHNLPAGLDFVDLLTENPVNQVYFRAGLLACREYMARFVEQGGDTKTAASIRANWWPQLGDDPGPPRLFSFGEVAEEVEGPNGEYQVRSKSITPNIEALPRAYQFLLPPAGTPS